MCPTRDPLWQNLSLLSTSHLSLSRRLHQVPFESFSRQHTQLQEAALPAIACPLRERQVAPPSPQLFSAVPCYSPGTKALTQLLRQCELRQYLPIPVCTLVCITWSLFILDSKLPEDHCYLIFFCVGGVQSKNLTTGLQNHFMVLQHCLLRLGELAPSKA